MGQTRGRRREKKKGESGQEVGSFQIDHSSAAKNTVDFGSDFIALDAESADPAASESTPAAFYGLLDRQELEYFQNAESTLAANALTSEEREPFVNSVFQEAKGKELKLATNKILSKLVERLIFMSDDRQLVDLLRAFSGHVYRLSLQKYSSHCLESLFVRCAGLVDRELLGTAELSNPDDPNEVVVSAESLIVYLVNELQPHVTAMVNEKYSSHVLRSLLLLLSGLPLTSDSALRSRKSKLARKFTELDRGTASTERQVPAAFKEASKEITKDLTGALTAVDARRMAIDPLGSPLLQVILRVQIARDHFTIVDLLLKGDGADAFWEHILSEKVGSHFLESVLSYLPRKILNGYYDKHFKGRVAKLAKREGGNFVVEQLLKSSLGPKPELIRELVPDIKGLLEENRVNVVSTALQFAEPAVRDEISKVVVEHYGGIGPLVLSSDTDVGAAKLVEALVSNHEILNQAGQYLNGLATDELKKIALDSIQSHVLEAMLRPEMDAVERRKLLHSMTPLLLELSPHSSGSHIVDKLWPFAYKLKFARERIAEVLSKQEDALKKSTYGKIVWRNWHLDKYVRKRNEWWNAVKASEDALRAKLGDGAPAAKSISMRSKPGNIKTSRPIVKQAVKPYDR